MLQTLFHIPREWHGWPVFGFGILLTAWLIFCAGWMIYLVRRQGFNADTWSYLPILGLIAAAIAFLLPALIDDSGLPIRGYGVMVVAAIVAAREMGNRRAARVGINPDLMNSLMFWMLIPGIIGGRIFYIIEYWNEYQGHSGMRQLFELANLAEGGLVVYGAALGALVGFLAFIRMHHMPGLALADLIVPGCALAMGLGRIGCFLSGCCFGGPTDLPWAVRFPQGSPPYMRQVELGQMPIGGLFLAGRGTELAKIAGVEKDSAAEKAGIKVGEVIARINEYPVPDLAAARTVLASIQQPGADVNVLIAGERTAKILQTPATLPRSLPVHPTQLYSMLDGVLLALLLVAWTPYRRRDGELLALYLTIYAVLRFLEEIIRTDEPGVAQTGLTISQNISIAVLLGAVCLWIYIWRQPAGLARFTQRPQNAGRPSPRRSHSTA